MVASIWLRAAHRGVPNFLVTALVLGQSPMALAESPAQRQELIAALRQLDALERTVADSAAHTPITPGERYHFDYPRLLADLARVRAGVPGAKGDRSAGSETFTVTFPDRKPHVAFRGTSSSRSSWRCGGSPPSSVQPAPSSSKRAT